MTRHGIRAIGCRIAVAAALAAGCQTPSSADLRTGGISAEIRVSATAASAADVSVQMSPGNGFDPRDLPVVL